MTGQPCTASVPWRRWSASPPRRCARGRTATARSFRLRSPGGQRLYSRDHVEQLRFVREHIDAGLQPADAHRLLAQGRRPGSRAVTGRAMGPTRAPDEPGDGRLVILLAERDPYAAEFADYFLRTEGYAVRIVLDAVEAGRILAADPPHLVVVDLLISGGAGLALCRATRERGSIPILAVSAIASGDAALESGADAFLQKPVDTAAVRVHRP